MLYKYYKKISKEYYYADSITFKTTKSRTA